MRRPCLLPVPFVDFSGVTDWSRSPDSTATREWVGGSPLRERGGRRHETHVRYVDGAAGERLRSELAAITRELLEWAAHASKQESEDGEAA
ncbi:hypothetical protein [Haloechinothrix salitolerans]|uniref:Uncharacterized protein n=1 Tax=Haloechinothrix salitolerans TaxID=926830 RepID=A0ABW2C3R0_9PSEU